MSFAKKLEKLERQAMERSTCPECFGNWQDVHVRWEGEEDEPPASPCPACGEAGTVLRVVVGVRG